MQQNADTSLSLKLSLSLSLCWAISLYRPKYTLFFPVFPSEPLTFFLKAGVSQIVLNVRKGKRLTDFNGMSTRVGLFYA